MITREQLEKAAKAAGITNLQKSYDYGDDFGYSIPTSNPQQRTPWNPRINHGQLFDLAMACKIKLDPVRNRITYLDSILSAKVKFVDHQDFPALAEAVIMAASEER